MNGMNAFIKRTSESLLAPSTTVGHSEKSAVCNQENDPHLNLAMLAS